GPGPPLALRGPAAAADGYGGRDPYDYALRPGTPTGQRDRLTVDKVGAMRLTIGVMGSSGGDLSEADLAKAHRLGEAIAACDAVLITGGCPGLPYAAARGAKAKGGL